MTVGDEMWRTASKCQRTTNRETYSRMTYDQLLRLAQQMDQLVPEARIALSAELAKRKVEPEETAGDSQHLHTIDAEAGNEGRNVLRSAWSWSFGLFLMRSSITYAAKRGCNRDYQQQAYRGSRICAGVPGNAVDWFSARLTIGDLSCRHNFDRKKINGKWVYRPAHNAKQHE